MESKKLYNIRMTLKPAEIMTFVSGLHDIQADMIESVVESKAQQGYPEATEIINHIRSLK
jgi:hypothetical protein